MTAIVSGHTGAYRAVDRPPAEAGLSIVVPVYNEGAGLLRLHAGLTEVIERLRLNRGLACEILYVDDGSRDDSLPIAKTLRAKNCDIQVVSLSRNFGKEAALLAGLEHALNVNLHPSAPPHCFDVAGQRLPSPAAIIVASALAGVNHAGLRMSS